MKRFLPLFFLAACGTHVPTCDETNPLLRGCNHENRIAIEAVKPPPPCEDCHPPHSDDPEPPGCRSGKDCANGFERDPDAYREWRERQGRPLE